MKKFSYKKLKIYKRYKNMHYNSRALLMAIIISIIISLLIIGVPLLLTHITN